MNYKSITLLKTKTFKSWCNIFHNWPSEFHSWLLHSLRHQAEYFARGLLVQRDTAHNVHIRHRNCPHLMGIACPKRHCTIRAHVTRKASPPDAGQQFLLLHQQFQQQLAGKVVGSLDLLIVPPLLQRIYHVRCVRAVHITAWTQSQHK